MPPIVETLGVAVAAALALAFQPWRSLRAAAIRAPWGALAVALPLLWGVQQRVLPPGLPMLMSGACLAVLLLGWPLATLTLIAVAAAGALLGGADWSRAVELAAWNGVVPAAAGLAIGLATRRWLPRHPFVFILGRAFAGTALAMMLAGALWIWRLPAAPEWGDGVLATARWLAAWGEAFLTGGLAAVFVAYRPEWVATWSDARYLPPLGPPQ